MTLPKLSASVPTMTMSSPTSLPVILASITASSVQKHDVLATFTRLLVEDLASSPKRRLDIDVTANNGVLVKLRLVFCWSCAGMGVMQQLQDSTPDMCPVGERILRP